VKYVKEVVIPPKNVGIIQEIQMDYIINTTFQINKNLKKNYHPHNNGQNERTIRYINVYNECYDNVSYII